MRPDHPAPAGFFALKRSRALLQAAVFASALAVIPAGAQLATPDPDWKESDTPVPPAFSLDRLIVLDMPRGALRYGIDPASVSVGPDGIVRYVVVASSATGTTNAMYEGIRCGAAEVKVYARHNSDSGWTPVRDAVWRPLHDNHPSRHSLTIARTGACMGHAPNRSATQIVRDLRAPADLRFSTEAR